MRLLSVNLIAIFCCGVAGFVPYCDNFSNITGLVIGVFLGNLRLRFLLTRLGALLLGDSYPLMKIIFMMFSLLFIVGVLGGSIAAFLFHTDLAQYCLYCNYINCVSVLPSNWCVPIN
jgi:hypothetical protein